MARGTTARIARGNDKTIGLPKLSRQTPSEGRAKMVAQGISTEDAFTEQTVHVSARRWMADPSAPHGMASAEVDIDLVICDGSAAIITRSFRFPSCESNDRIDLENGGLRAEEVELFAAAITEAVRLGKERGVFGGGAK